MEVSPGQRYATASGHLYHAGKICIALVGPPARGKTSRATAIQRYLRWLGVRVQTLHLVEYQRHIVGSNEELPQDYFVDDPNPEIRKKRDSVVNACLEDAWKFYEDGGQVVIYDAINPTKRRRADLAQRFKDHGVECLFVECLVTNKKILARNLTELAPPEEKGNDKSLARYLAHIEMQLSRYETMEEHNHIYIKIFNDGEKFIVNQGSLGYLLNRVCLFLLNARRRTGSVYFARAGLTANKYEVFRSDDGLSSEGRSYARILTNTLLKHLSSRDTDLLSSALQRLADLQKYADTVTLSESVSSPNTAPTTASNTPLAPHLLVWTSVRRKTEETSQFFQDAGVPTSHRAQLTLRNPGEVEGLTQEAIKTKFPEEFEVAQADPYHYRYPRAESYQDVATRLEPLILEMERVQQNLLIIAHESVLAVLYGYYMGSTVDVIPTLEFPANQIVELKPCGYSYVKNIIPVPGVTAIGGLKSDE